MKFNSNILKTSQAKLMPVARIFKGNSIREALANVKTIKSKRIYTYIYKSLVNLKSIIDSSKVFNEGDCYIEQCYAVRYKSSRIIRRHAKHRVSFGNRNFSRLVFIIAKKIHMLN